MNEKNPGRPTEININILFNLSLNKIYEILASVALVKQCTLVLTQIKTNAFSYLYFVFDSHWMKRTDFRDALAFSLLSSSSDEMNYIVGVGVKDGEHSRGRSSCFLHSPAPSVGRKVRYVFILYCLIVFIEL